MHHSFNAHDLHITHDLLTLYCRHSRPQYSIGLIDEHGNKTFIYSSDEVKSVHWYLASLTKAVTAELVQNVTQHHSIDANSDINSILPELDVSGSIDDLMCMSLGFLGNGASQFGFDSSISKEQRLKRFNYSRRNKNFNGYAEYHNGYYVAARIALERIANQSYETLLDKFIRRPLGLTQLFSINEYKEAQFRSPLLFNGSEFQKVPFLIHDNSLGAGGLISNHYDYLSYLEHVREKSVPAMRPLKNADTFLAGHSYGYGWFSGYIDGSNLRFHSGSGPGYGNFTVHFENEKFTLSVLADYHVDLATLVAMEVLSMWGYNTYDKISTLCENLKQYLKFNPDEDGFSTGIKHGLGHYYNAECGVLIVFFDQKGLRMEFIDCSLSNGYLLHKADNRYTIIFDNPACRLDPLEKIEVRFMKDAVDLDFYGRFELTTRANKLP